MEKILQAISVKDKPLPRDGARILVVHKYGMDYIRFGSGAWRFCYTGREVDKEFPDMMGNITHYYHEEIEVKQILK